MMHLNRLLTLSLSAVLFAACGGGNADQAASVDQTLRQAAVPQALCDLLPRADAEKIMGKALVERRNDDWACHYEDAKGTAGTGLMLDLYAIEASDQCRLMRGSEPLSGIGSEACITIGQPVGLYTTVAFKGGGRTFVVTAPGEDKTSELATAVARGVLSKLGV
ncbi:MAG TPA: hypothetical protein VJS12_04755 [Steroidobacteraceae bacterium]|nr:hypothetical protein [Steroidobacteraceae bacterium]